MVNDRFRDNISTWEDRRGFTLSDRVWQNGEVQRARMDAILRDAVSGGATIGDAEAMLTQYLNPNLGGNATYYARNLIGNETRIAHAKATRWDAALKDRLLKYNTSLAHPAPDECDDNRDRNTGHGPGVYTPDAVPMPPVHIGCLCYLSTAPARLPEYTGDMTQYAEQLRVSYGLDTEPTNLSPAELVRWRQETKRIREQVSLGVRGWHEQTGLVTLDQMAWRTSTVREWMNGVRVANGMVPLADTWRVLPRSVSYDRAADLAGLRGGRYGEVVLTPEQAAAGVEVMPVFSTPVEPVNVVADRMRSEGWRTATSQADIDAMNLRIEAIRDPNALYSPTLTPVTPQAVTTRQAWKPSLTPEEAQRFAAEGAFPDRQFFHFTQDTYAAAIREEGFKLRGGWSAYGDGVYTTSMPDFSATGVGGGSNTEMLQLVTRVKNPYYYDGTNAYPQTKEIFEQGYDSIVVHRPGFQDDWLIVVDPEDISVIDIPKVP